MARLGIRSILQAVPLEDELVITPRNEGIELQATAAPSPRDDPKALEAELVALTEDHRHAAMTDPTILGTESQELRTVIQSRKGLPPAWTEVLTRLGFSREASDSGASEARGGLFGALRGASRIERWRIPYVRARSGSPLLAGLESACVRAEEEGEDLLETLEGTLERELGAPVSRSLEGLEALEPRLGLDCPRLVLHPALAEALGAYVAEVICATYPGTDVDPDGEPPVIVAVGGERIGTHPIHRVARRVIAGSEESLSGYVRSLGGANA